MLQRLGALATERYIICRPPRVLPLISAGIFTIACVSISVAFLKPAETRGVASTPLQAASDDSSEKVTHVPRLQLQPQVEQLV
jgi:hypothetical protein